MMAPLFLLTSRYLAQVYRGQRLDVKRYARNMTHQTGPVSAPPVSDEVDDIVSRWQTVRPDLDVSPLQVLSRVSRLARHLDRARRAAFAAHGLETWEFDVLSALRRQGQPYQLSPGALLRATLVTSGTMTNRIDRMSQAGLVSRHRDPLDKRGVLVQLTAEGLRTVDAAMSDLLERERALLTALDAAQQDELAGLLRTLVAPFDAATEQPAGPEAR
jgi:DNA-binding MarR family transcriptional regulator